MDFLNGQSETVAMFDVAICKQMALVVARVYLELEIQKLATTAVVIDRKDVVGRDM